MVGLEAPLGLRNASSDERVFETSLENAEAASMVKTALKKNEDKEDDVKAADSKDFEESGR